MKIKPTKKSEIFKDICMKVNGNKRVYIISKTKSVIKCNSLNVLIMYDSSVYYINI